MDKAPDAFRTISEVADELDVPQHVLRFWESRFRDIKPMKRGGGRRYYRPDDINLLRGIRHLLYGEGYTIRGVQRILKEQGVKFLQSVWRPDAPQLRKRATDDEVTAGDSAAPVEQQRPPRRLGPPPAGDGARAEPPPRPPAERREPSLPLQRIVPPASPTGLAQADLRKLQEALQQLSECRAQLDAALSETLLEQSGKP